MCQKTLFVVAVFILFANFSCPEECESLFFGGSTGAPLAVELSNPAVTYLVGDEFELRANFSAVLDGPQGLSYRISDNGGLIVTEVYRISPDTFLLEPALSAFGMSTLAGELLAPPEGDVLDAAARVRYRCTAGVCSFAQSFQALQPGNYLLRVTGGPIDEIQANFNYCEAPNLSVTTLSGGANPGPATSASHYQTPYGEAFWPFYNPLISVEGERNAYFFTVE